MVVHPITNIAVSLDGAGHGDFFYADSAMLYKVVVALTRGSAVKLKITADQSSSQWHVEFKGWFITSITPGVLWSEKSGRTDATG